MTTSTEQGYYWSEALPDLIEEVDWSGVTSEQWEAISGGLNEHVSNARDFSAPTPSVSDLQESRDRPVIAALEAEVARLTAQIDIFEKDIKRHFGGDQVDADLHTGRVIITDRR
jgi:hypothetical protein